MKASVPRSVALYRFFGRDGSLLYVGITNNPAARFSAHRCLKHWWNEVDPSRTSIVWHLDQGQAAAAEIKAIALEKPKYNVGRGGEGCRIMVLSAQQQSAMSALRRAQAKSERVKSASDRKLWTAVCALRETGMTDTAIRVRTGLSERLITEKLGPPPESS